MLLNNRYKIIQTLESGGCGETFLAEDTHMPSRRHCVIKQLKPATDDPFAYEIIKERFKFEAATLESIGEACDQIPQLHAYFTENKEFYLVQDFIEGKTLRRKVLEEGLFSENVARKFLVSLLNLLSYLHSRNIIHRDIKPDNIIIRAGDNVPVLIDFGAVKEVVTMVSSEGTLAKSIVIGSPGFMPPEQALGFPVFASDLYSLGKTTIFALTGKSPRELDQLEQNGVHWKSFAPMVSPDLTAVLDKATRPAYSDRYESAHEMLQAVELDNTRASRETIPPVDWILPQPPVKDKKSSTLQNTLIAVLGGLFLIALIFAISFAVSKKRLSDQLSQQTDARAAAESKVKDLESKLNDAEGRARKAEGAASDIEKSIREGKVYRVAQVNNRTNNDIKYQLLQSDGTWKQIEIKAGETYQHWRRNSDVVIKFDYSFSDGYQERRYTLDTSNVYGHEPTQAEEDAAELYYFATNTSGDLDLFHSAGQK